MRQRKALSGEARAVIVEERIYTLQAGQAAAYLTAYEAEGMAIQKPILGRMVGYYATEFGPLNQVIHLWAYEDLAERTERRALLLSDPRWRVYAAKVRPMVVRQENKLLLPAPFMKVRWQGQDEVESRRPSNATADAVGSGAAAQ